MELAFEAENEKAEKMFTYHPFSSMLCCESFSEGNLFKYRNKKKACDKKLLVRKCVCVCVSVRAREQLVPFCPEQKAILY